MSDIDFLGHKNNGREQDEKADQGEKEKLSWSEPDKPAKGLKSSPFFFLPFKNKLKPAGQAAATAVDKNKVRQSRQEILRLIKRHENSKPAEKSRARNFLAVLAEKFKKQPDHKQVLINLEQVFSREKERKSQISHIFQRESEPAKNEPPIQPKNEPKPEIKEIKEKPPAAKPAQPQSQEKHQVLETNLIKGEIVSFFDWREKIAVLAGAILIPLAIILASYFGLFFYQKASRAKNLEQAKKYQNLEKDIAQEETGVKDIFPFQAELKTVAQIFGQHLYWTNFFRFLEDNTIKDVYFVNFKGNTSGNYALDALAVAYGNIAEQINALKGHQKIISAEAGGGEMVGGDDKNKPRVKFILKLSIDKSIFND